MILYTNLGPAQRQITSLVWPCYKCYKGMLLPMIYQKMSFDINKTCLSTE